MKKELKYIGFYGGKESDPDRYSSMSAVSKMDYVSRKINECGLDVKIISPSWLHERSFKLFSLGMTISPKNGLTAVFFPGIRASNILTRILSRFLSRFFLFIYLILFVKRGELILVYHSQTIAGTLFLARALKRFKIILEIEEVYGKVWKRLSGGLKAEMRLISVSTSFLCVNDNLAELVRPFGRPTVVLYGSYSVLSDNPPLCKRQINKSGVIRLVYAGSVESQRSGAGLAIEAMKSLDTGYELSIIGPGDSHSIEILINKINELNFLRNRIVCRYYEPLSGSDFTDFLYEHDIGINPQFTGGYMATAFPSKILTYLAHDLRVVSTPVGSVQNSKIKDLINFSDDDSPCCMAIAIRQVDLQTISPQVTLKLIDMEFVKSLNSLLEKDFNFM